jgi:hypothetical protein
MHKRIPDCNQKNSLFAIRPNSWEFCLEKSNYQSIRPAEEGFWHNILAPKVDEAAG